MELIEELSNDFIDKKLVVFVDEDIVCNVLLEVVSMF